ncbi:MAG: hypothetical protein WDO16_11680 [Bacteroidota bacterium]
MKPRISTVILALLLTITASNVHAITIDDTNPKKEQVADMTEGQKAARMEEIKGRLNEIKTMDKSELSKTERKALRKELKDMKKEARAMSGGVYLSVGAIIIIILLLILIL